MFQWTDELVIDFIKFSNGEHTPDKIEEYKSLKRKLPASYIKVNRFTDASGSIIDVKDDWHCIDMLYSNNFKIYSVIIKDELYTVGDTVLNRESFVKYGGKKSNYLIRIDSLDRKNYNFDELSTTIFINGFYPSEHIAKLN